MPNFAIGASGGVLSLVLWRVGALAPEPLVAGACVGLLEGMLDLLGRRQNLPHLRKAETFGAGIVAYQHSRWTRAKDLITFACLVVIAMFLVRRTEQSAHFSVVSMFISFASVSLLELPRFGGQFVVLVS